MDKKTETANAGEDVKKSFASSGVLPAAQTYSSQNNLFESADIVKKGTKTLTTREVWGKKLDFLLSVAGGFIGLGNIWRFPYLCYRNGGGAFLIPYFIFLLFAGIPIFYLEVGLGQFTSEGGITAWERIAPITAGIGYGSIALTIILNMYYIIVLAWALYYMWFSFSYELPWTYCGEWASNCCIKDGETKPAALCVRNDMVDESNHNVTSNWTSPTQEFWENKVLRVTHNIDEMGNINGGMVLCLTISWVISYLCVLKGVKQTGKVVYFTATFPIFMLIVLLIRGITLPNAWNGVYYYLVPNMEKMMEPKVWVEAGTQIFFSYALCKGQLISLGSYNKYKTDIYKDVWLLSAFNSGTSFVSGFAIFSILGYMASERQIDISEVAESGPGLAFIAYPRAVALLPYPQLWAVLFFFMILLLGLDSQFVGLEAVITAVSDLYPECRKGIKRQYLILTIVAVSFSVGLTMCFDGGIYIFTLFDHYGASGVCLLWLCFCECIALGWVYGGEKFWKNTKSMVGYRPFPLFKWCWQLITPVMISVLCILFFKHFKPFVYKNTRKTYIYPTWFESIGWCLASCSILPVIIYALVRTIAIFITNREIPIREKWNALIMPNLKNDHPTKKIENDAIEYVSTESYYLGDWLAGLLNNKCRRRTAYYASGYSSDDIIRYDSNNTNC